MKSTSDTVMQRLRWPLRLTWAGLLAERFWRAFWPLISLVLLVIGLLMFGLHEHVPLEVVWGASVLCVLGGIASLVYALRRFRWPGRAEAMVRLDETLPGRPIAALNDQQVIGADDPASRAVWKAHAERMAARAEKARAPRPDLRIARRDPYALRYVALLAFVMALIFGSVFRLATVSQTVAGGGPSLAAGPTWEGWVQPPAYTGKPSLYLADQKGETLAVPVGSHVTLRLYGELGALTVSETVSGRTADVGSAAEAAQEFDVTRSGELAINGPGGRSWEIRAIADTPPTVALAGKVERSPAGEMRLPYTAQDDYGITSGRAEIELDLARVDRRFGLVVDPEPRGKIVLDLPLPFNGERRDISETLVEDLSQHAWAGLPVTITLFATDAAGQSGQSKTEKIILQGRRFFDPLAAALVEQRRYLLWSRTNASQVVQILRAVSNRPEEVFKSDADYLKLRVAMKRLEAGLSAQGISPALRDEVAQALWDIAVSIEEGNLGDAREKLRQARERLEQAMRDGASDEEIAKLMDDYNKAMQEYLRQLEREQANNSQPQPDQPSQTITQDQLQQMMDRIQELMKEGRMGEAQQLLDELSRMMENMQVTQGNGKGQQSPGQKSLDGLSDTLREQQDLNDQTFRDLQQQFNQEGRQPGPQGQQEGPGPQGDQPNGQDGRKNQPGQEQEQGQGAQGGEQGPQGRGGPDGTGRLPGQGERRGVGNDPARGLAERQQALRQQLDEQRRNLPGAGTPGGKEARDALGRAGRAMDGAEQALRDRDYAGALDKQAEALDALRDGMRNLSQELAQQQSRQNGQQGQASGQARRDNQRDPLGRDAGAAGRIGTDEQTLQGQDVYRRARELLDEIRRRASEQNRPKEERGYLQRLLDKF